MMSLNSSVSRKFKVESGKVGSTSFSLRRLRRVIKSLDDTRNLEPETDEVLETCNLKPATDAVPETHIH